MVLESQPQMDEISWEANGREETCVQISMLKYKEEKEPVKKMNRGAGKLGGKQKMWVFRYQDVEVFYVGWHNQWFIEDRTHNWSLGLVTRKWF